MGSNPFYETLEFCKQVSKMVNMVVYLKRYGGGWFLQTEPPTGKYFVVHPDGSTSEISKEGNN